MYSSQAHTPIERLDHRHAVRIRSEEFLAVGKCAVLADVKRHQDRPLPYPVICVAIRFRPSLIEKDGLLVWSAGRCRIYRLEVPGKVSAGNQ